MYWSYMTSTCVLKTRNKMYTWVTKYDYHLFFRFIMYYFCFIIIMKNSESVPPPKDLIKSLSKFQINMEFFVRMSFICLTITKYIFWLHFKGHWRFNMSNFEKFTSKARIADLRRKESIISIQRWILQTKTTPSADNRSDLLTSNNFFYVR